LEHKETLGLKVPLEHKVTKVVKVLLGLRVPLVLKVTKVAKVLLEHKVLLELKVLLDLLEVLMVRFFSTVVVLHLVMPV
jgi:hypothetical protein